MPGFILCGLQDFGLQVHLLCKTDICSNAMKDAANTSEDWTSFLHLHCSPSVPGEADRVPACFQHALLQVCQQLSSPAENFVKRSQKHMAQAHSALNPHSAYCGCTSGTRSYHSAGISGLCSMLVAEVGTSDYQTCSAVSSRYACAQHWQSLQPLMAAADISLHETIISVRPVNML